MTNRKYFYKEVENALYRLSECYADIEKSMSANTEIPQMQIISALMEVFNDFKWSKHESVAHLNLQENELTDEDKEKIAISNKEDLQELINVVDEQIKFLGAYKDTCNNIMLASNTLNTLINEFAIDQLSYDFLDENNDPGLNLTDEELYYALLFFDKEQVRRLLSSQTPKTFNILYQSFLRGKSDFLDALNGLEYTMIPSLRNALKAKMDEHNESCFTKFDMSDLPLLKLLADEVCEDDILFVIDQLEALQRGDILNIEAFNIDSINKFFTSLTMDYFNLAYNNPDITKSKKKKILNFYNEWRNNNPSIPLLEELPIKNELSHKIYRIAIALIDKKILDAIHDKMEQNNIGSAKEDENKAEKAMSPMIEINRLKALKEKRHLDFPSRLVNNSEPNRIFVDEHIPILTEIYNLYGGGFEKITCEEFLYLFGATKEPPFNYDPPYYWSGDHSTMKALIRILYSPQPKILKSLILHTSDKELGVKSHDWGRNKNKVAYVDIETNIIDIIKRVTGKILKKL